MTLGNAAEFYGSFNNASDFLGYRRSHTNYGQRLKRLLYDDDRRKEFLADNHKDFQSTVGFKVRRYLSGETTGAMFMTGLQGKIIPSPRTGPLITSDFTIQARHKIRRAAENSPLPLKYFVTLTFAPQLLQPWEKDELGKVRHDFAKFRLHRFLDALGKYVKRRYSRSLLYVWVAELQDNGNIHFHLLLNEYIPIHSWVKTASGGRRYMKSRNGSLVTSMTKLWGQADNSVDVRTLNDQNHAVNYMRKYLTKDEKSEISGNRYNISKELRSYMKPEEINVCQIPIDEESEGLHPHQDVLDLLHDLQADIERGGGKVLDFGFNIPAPRRSRSYRLDRDSEHWSRQGKKKGDIVKTRGVSKDLAPNILELLTGDDDAPF